MLFIFAGKGAESRHQHASDCIAEYDKKDESYPAERILTRQEEVEQIGNGMLESCQNEHRHAEENAQMGSLLFVDGNGRMKRSASGCLMESVSISAPLRPSCATSRVELE